MKNATKLHAARGRYRTIEVRVHQYAAHNVLSPSTSRALCRRGDVDGYTNRPSPSGSEHDGEHILSLSAVCRTMFAHHTRLHGKVLHNIVILGKAVQVPEAALEAYGDLRAHVRQLLLNELRRAGEISGG